MSGRGNMSEGEMSRGGMSYCQFSRPERQPRYINYYANPKTMLTAD